MASRTGFTMAMGRQTAKGTPLTTGLKAITEATWDPGIAFANVPDDSNRPGTRLGKPGRPGLITLAPTFRVNFASTAYDDMMAGLFQSAWAGTGTNQLVQGQAPGYFTFEDRQVDASSYVLLTDMVFNTLRLAFAPGALVPATFGAIGLGLVSSGIPTPSLAAANDDDTFDTFNGSLLYGGAAYDVTQLNLNIDNRGEARPKLWSRYPNRIVFAPDRVTGDFTAQYVGPTNLLNTMNNVKSALSFTMTGHDALGAPKSHTWLMAVTQNVGWTSALTTDPERVEQVSFELDAFSALSTLTKISLTRA